MDSNNLKRTIYSKLSEVLPGKVFQTRPEVINTVPCITFHFIENLPELSLDKSILRQKVRVQIDIWAEDSAQGGDLYNSVIEKMLELNFICGFYREIKERTGGTATSTNSEVYHLTTQFIY